MSFDGVSADLYERLSNKAGFFRHALKYYAENSELCSNFFDDKEKVAVILEKNRNGEYGESDKRSRSYKNKNIQDSSLKQINRDNEVSEKIESRNSIKENTEKNNSIFANGIKSGSSYD